MDCGNPGCCNPAGVRADVAVGYQAFKGGDAGAQLATDAATTLDNRASRRKKQGGGCCPCCPEGCVCCEGGCRCYN